MASAARLRPAQGGGASALRQQAVQGEHREVEVEKEKAEKELKELMARFKLRKVR